MTYKLELLSAEGLSDHIRTVGLGISRANDDNGNWYCSTCSKDQQRVLMITLETEDEDTLATYICEHCLYELVRDKRLAVINFRTYARVMSEPSEPASPSATVDEDGVISIDGIAVNFT